MAENRRHERAPLDLEVTLSILGDDTAVPARARDVSLGGMFVETKLVPPFGIAVVVVLTLPSGERLRIPARVRWTRPGGVGVQFGLIGAHETHALLEMTKKAS